VQFKLEKVKTLSMEEPRNKKVNRDRWELDRVRFQMDKPMAPQRDPVAVKDIVADVAAGLEQPLQESIRVLRSVWSQLVGPSISLYSEPGFIKEGILYVFVSQAGWISELERNRRSLLFKIENQYTEMDIRRLQFELRRPD
jgi:hypothetical protein